MHVNSIADDARNADSILAPSSFVIDQDHGIAPNHSTKQVEYSHYVESAFALYKGFGVLNAVIRELLQETTRPT